MDSGLILSIIGIIIGIILAVIGIIFTLTPSKFQKKPKLNISFDLEKMYRIKAGKKFEMGIKVANNGDVVSIESINLCIPVQLGEIISIGHMHNDEYGRPLFTWGHKLEICKEFFSSTVTFLQYGNKLPKNSFKMFYISVLPKKLGIYKIPVILYAEVYTSLLKFPFKYMPNRKEIIRDELIIEVFESLDFYNHIKYVSIL